MKIKTCENCARHTNTNGYGVCFAPKTKVCSYYVTEEELEEEVQSFYNKNSKYAGD